MSELNVNAITDASGGNTTQINGATPTNDNLMGRNRIINGAMEIAQRGTSAVTASGSYPVDRFYTQISTDGAFSAQQDSSAPVGFVNSVKLTTTTADASLGATQYWIFRHKIEGYNVADLDWGTANAKTVTVSFWVRSSLTGTFGGVLANTGQSRIYPFTYTISAADTWEQKSLTIAGDTTGTWLTNNGTGLEIIFGLGVGTDYSGTAGSWSGTFALSATGATSVIGTLNATWYITGVQLEAGSVATSFERRSYGQELALCQRYTEVFRSDGAGFDVIAAGFFESNTDARYGLFFNEKRTSPSVTFSAANQFTMYYTGTTAAATSITAELSSTKSARIYVTGPNGTDGQSTLLSFYTNNGNGYIVINAEL